jgi:hydrogenase nickel incorporation protein HypB
MCGTCGCGQGEKRVEDIHLHQADEPADHGHSHEHGHDNAHGHEYSHTHPDGTTHSHSHGHEHAHEHAHASSHQHTGGGDADGGETRLLSVERDILARNDAIAAENRRALQAAKTLALNLVSSPGSGKTALLVETLKRIGDKCRLAVIEGDQKTTADADRIRATGVPAIQINTGKGCHLDADLVRTAMARLGTPANGILFIENVGNLVCPAGFDLGEAHKVVIVSVTEGEDKPLKYSGMFAASALMVVTKTDLLPHLDIDIDRLIENARRINPMIGVLKLSAKSGEGMDRWIHWLETARALRLATD